MNSTMDTDPRFDASRTIRAPRGTVMACKSWQAEAAYRMLQNNLDPEVAENPQHLVVYGGIGRAARNWACFDQILASLRELEDDQTLLIQSGKPVGVFQTHADAPRVLIANSNLVPKWANWEHFNELDRQGLFMYGQMTAGSWIYIGTQGIVQGTYETFAEAGRQHFGGDWGGRWILTAGLGGMGGAQPLAATMAGAVSLNIECQQSSIDFRLRPRYLDKQAASLDEALELVKYHTERKEAISIGLLGNAAEVLPELVRRAKAGGLLPDLVTDQTSAHDLVNGYLPRGWSVSDWKAAQQDPQRHARLTVAAADSCAAHVQAMLDFHAMGVHTVDYGNNIRQVAFDQGVQNAFDFPGFVPAYIRPQFCEGRGPFRWVALSGDPEDIYKTDAKIKELFPHHTQVHHWLDMARERIAFQGLPARICWLGLGERHLAVNGWRLGHRSPLLEGVLHRVRAGQQLACAMQQGLCLRAVVSLFNRRDNDCQCLLRLACLQQAIGVGIMKVALITGALQGFVQIGQGRIVIAQLACEQTHVVIGDSMVGLHMENRQVQCFSRFQAASLVMLQRQRQGDVYLHLMQCLVAAGAFNQ